MSTQVWEYLSVSTKPGRFTLFLNNTNPNTILLSIGTIPIQYNSMQYLSVLTTIHPNIRMSTVWCKVMCGLLLQLWKKCTWFIKCTKKHFVLWDYWGTVWFWYTQFIGGIALAEKTMVEVVELLFVGWGIALFVLSDFGQKIHGGSDRIVVCGLNCQTTYFLVACTRLYKSLCRSVRRSVGPSVRPSVKLYFFCCFELFKGWIVDV